MPPSPDRRDGRNQGRAAEDGTLHSDTQAKLEFLKSAAHKNSLNMLPAALDELWDATAGSEMVAEMIGDDLESFNTLVYLSRTVQEASPKTQLPAVNILANVPLNFGAEGSAAAARQAHEILLDNVGRLRAVASEEAKELVSASLRAIAQLLSRGPEEQRDAATAAATAKVTAAAMTRAAGSRRLREFGCRVLAALAVTEEGADAVVQAAGHKVAFAVLLRGLGSEAFARAFAEAPAQPAQPAQLAALACLRNLAGWPRARAALVLDLPPLPALAATFLVSDSPDAGEHAAAALAGLVQVFPCSLPHASIFGADATMRVVGANATMRTNAPDMGSAGPAPRAARRAPSAGSRCGRTAQHPVGRAEAIRADAWHFLATLLETSASVPDWNAPALSRAAPGAAPVFAVSCAVHLALAEPGRAYLHAARAHVPLAALALASARPAAVRAAALLALANLALSAAARDAVLRDCPAVEPACALLFAGRARVGAAASCGEAPEAGVALPASALLRNLSASRASRLAVIDAAIDAAARVLAARDPPAGGAARAAWNAGVQAWRDWSGQRHAPHEARARSLPCCRRPPRGLTSGARGQIVRANAAAILRNAVKLAPRRLGAWGLGSAAGGCARVVPALTAAVASPAAWAPLQGGAGEGLEGRDPCVAEHCAEALRGIAEASPEGLAAVRRCGGAAALAQAAAGARASGDTSGGGLFASCMAALQVVAGSPQGAAAEVERARAAAPGGGGGGGGGGAAGALAASHLPTRAEAARAHAVEGAGAVLVARPLPAPRAGALQPARRSPHEA